ncbi:hypothetical protein V8C35DRAFT_302287 [Trichoderma chlorosporum]
MAVPPEPFARGRAQPHRATPGRARSCRFVWSAALLLGAPLMAAAQSFPYVPTQILTPDACYDQTKCYGADVAYILTQDSNDNVQFLSLNISGTIAADVQLTPVSTSLPFVGGDNSQNTAFGAVRTEEGAVLVYSGECDQGPGNVWMYGEGVASGGIGTSAWVKHATTLGDSQTTSSSRGPYFLGGTIAFSGTLAPLLEEPTIYSYGGMCDTPSDSSKDWQSAANYTTGMVILDPTENSPSSSSWAQGPVSNSGPKTAIAGFSLTALQSSMSNTSGTVTQQTAYVVIGGHTKQAFINMSTAAVWNLPEETWSYVNVQQSTDSPDGVESRSGHTAILSQDGRSIIVLGGWVGDVTNAAEPQLAILEMGEAYNSWRWTIPQQQPNFGDTGIYGHGSAILPGNVMMVYGGWQISDSDSSSKRKRQSSVTTSPQFLNLTDLTWATTYNNPTPADADGKGPHGVPSTETDSAKSKVLGLSIGFGVGGGMVLLGLALGICFCWRKKQRRRAAREETIRGMAQDHSMFIHDSVDMAKREDVYPWGYRSWYTGGQDPYRSGGDDRSIGYENLRGSYGGYAPVVPGIARKPMSRQLRGSYVPANAQLNSFVSTPGQIHPIMEDEEEDLAYQHVHPEATTPTSDAYSDPFLTPTAAVASGGLPVFQPPPPGQSTAGPSTDGPFHHDPDVQDWVYDVDAADAMLARYNSTRQAQGRGSPTRRNSQRSSGAREDDLRTESGISESNRSAGDGLGRSSSGRWSAIIASAGLFGGSSVPTTEPGKPGSSSSSSYNTAKSGFGALQAEGPNLLLGRTTPSSPFDDDELGQPSSPSKSKPPRRSWLGSLRRVFSGSESTSGDLSVRDRSPQREISTDMLSHDYEPPLAALGSELLRRKQGRQDWETGAGSGALDRENEWDIERAVENRLVQVMFTVPKERLRVVNADDLDDGTSTDERQHLHIPQTAELVDMDKRSSIVPSLRSGSKLSSHLDDEGGGVPVDEGDRGDGFLRINQDDYEDRSEGSERGERGEMIERPLSVVTDMSRALSIATDVSFARSASVYTAEAMTFERPKTRVLQMVDRIESQRNTPSKETSPSVSRAGTPGIRSVKSKKSLRSEDLRRQ